MSSPRCPTCYRRLYDGISQEIHDIVECTLAEVKPPSKSRPAKSRRQANTLEEAAWLGTTAAKGDRGDPVSFIIGSIVLQTRDAHARLLTDLVKARVDAEDWAVKALERGREIDRLNAVVHVQQTQLATMRSAIRDADKLLGLRND